MTKEFYNLSDCEHLICEVLGRGGTFRFYPRGKSMEPTIHEGSDMVILSPLPERLKKYQIILYKRKNGQFILHRIIAVKGQEYVMRGDGQLTAEHGIQRGQMLGLVTGIVRNGTEVETAGIRCRAHIWMLVNTAGLRRYIRAGKRILRRLLK